MNWKPLVLALTIVWAFSSILMIGPDVDAMHEGDIQALANELVLPAESLPRAIENDIWIHSEAQRLINGAHFSEVFPDMIAETSYSVDYDNCAAVIDLLVDIIHTQKDLLSKKSSPENGSVL